MLLLFNKRCMCCVCKYFSFRYKLEFCVFLDAPEFQVHKLPESQVVFFWPPYNSIHHLTALKTSSFRPCFIGYRSWPSFESCICWHASMCSGGVVVEW